MPGEEIRVTYVPYLWNNVAWVCAHLGFILHTVLVVSNCWSGIQGGTRGGPTLMVSYTSTHDPDCQLLAYCIPSLQQSFLGSNSDFWAGFTQVWGYFRPCWSYLVEINHHCSSSSQQPHKCHLEVTKACNVTVDCKDTFSIVRTPPNPTLSWPYSVSNSRIDGF